MSQTAQQVVAGAESRAPAAPKRAGVMRRLLRRKRFVLSGSLVLFMLVMAAFPQLFTSRDPRAGCRIVNTNGAPSAEHWFGFGPQGCDYYANVIYGARSSITIGLVVTAGAFVIAAVLGALAGYFGGWIDTVISRLCDMMFGLPFILAAIVVLQLFSHRSVWIVCFVLTVFYWPGGVRYMRSSVMKVRSLEYVQASRVLGASSTRTLFEHVVPNSLTPLIVLKTLGIGTIIAAEAALTFIGVGLVPPAISWGLQLSEAKKYLYEAPHLIIFPSIFLSVTVLAFIMLGEVVRDTLDPKGR